MKSKHFKLGLAAFLVIAAGAAFAGMPIVPPDVIAAVGLAGLIGEVELTDVKRLIEEQGKAWDEFKKTNDARIAAIEGKGFAPADLDVQLAKINGEIDKLGKDIDAAIKAASRPCAGSDGEQTSAEHKSGIDRYMRKGESAWTADEVKAMSSQSDPDGGYLVTPEMDREIDRVASTVMAFDRIAKVVTVGSNSYKKLVKTRGVSGGWVGETEDSSEKNAPQYSEIEIPVHRVYAEPWIPNDLLEDAGYNLDGDLQDEAGITFGEMEGAAFVSGDGVKKARGFLDYSIVANASYAWGKLGYIASGASGAFAASNPGDKLISLQHSLRQQYRSGAVFLMNDSTLSSVRQMKDGSGAFYLWNPDPTAGFGGRLLGSPVEVDDNMPDVGANSYSIAYANFMRGYTIARRRGIAVIRDNVTKKGTTKMHMSRRVGGGVTNFEAIKVMKFAVS